MKYKNLSYDETGLLKTVISSTHGSFEAIDILVNLIKQYQQNQCIENISLTELEKSFETFVKLGNYFNNALAGCVLKIARNAESSDVH